MLRNRFEAKMWLKMLLLWDRNNDVKYCFKKSVGRKPFSSYDVITNVKFLDEIIEDSKDFDIEEWGIEKETIKAIINEKLHNLYL